MAERKSGPVKPPVIDLTARDAGSAATARPSAGRPSRSRPAAATAKPAEPPAPAAASSPGPAARPTPARPAEPASGSGPAAPPPRAAAEPPRASAVPPPPPRPKAQLAMPWSAISIAAAGGALLGTGLTYLLVTWLPLPASAPPFADPTARLESQAAALADAEARLAAIEAQARNTQVSLDATIAQLDGGLAGLREAIAALPQPAAAVDLAPLEQQLDNLSDRVAAMGAGASSADAAALAETIDQIETSLADLSTRLGALDQRFAGTETALATVTGELDAAKAAIAAQNQTLGGAEVGPAVRLPLLVAGLESAFLAGRPYRNELAGLTTLLPDLVVPEAVAAAAEAGLPRPDVVAAHFEVAVPGIITGRTAQPSGDWGRDAVEWLKSLLALRPAVELEGDTPEALLSRLEAAVDRRDFTAAATLLAALPQPMQDAAGPAGDEIVWLAAAEGFVTGLRAQALGPVAEATR